MIIYTYISYNTLYKSTKWIREYLWYVLFVVITICSFPQSWLITRFVLVHDLSPGLYSFMTYHQVCNKSNMTGATCGAGTAYPFKAPEFTPGFQWGSCCLILTLVFCVGFCRSLFVCPFVLFLLTIVLSVLRFTASDIWYLQTFLNTCICE